MITHFLLGNLHDKTDISAYLPRGFFFFFWSPISLLKTWPGKSEIEPVSEEEFIHPIKCDCMTGNSVYSVMVEMDIQFKLSQLLPLTPSGFTEVPTYLLGRRRNRIKILFLLTAKEYCYFSSVPVKKW